MVTYLRPDGKCPSHLFLYDFENLNIAEYKVTNHFFVFVAKTHKIPGEMCPPFFHSLENESRQNQNENMPNKSSYQKMKKTQKHLCGKKTILGSYLRLKT